MLGVETALWSTAAKKVGKWYRGFLEAAERYMVKWHEDEARLSRQCRASAVGGAQGNGWRGGNRRSRSETAVGESRKETAVKLARHQASY